MFQSFPRVRLQKKNTLFAYVKKFWICFLWEGFSINIFWNKNLKCGTGMVCVVPVKSAKFGQLLSCCSLHVLSTKLLQVFSLILMRLLPWSTEFGGWCQKVWQGQFRFLIALCEVWGLISRTKRSSQCSSPLDPDSQKEPPELSGMGWMLIVSLHLLCNVHTQPSPVHYRSPRQCVPFTVEVNRLPLVCPDKTARYGICHPR